MSDAPENTVVRWPPEEFYWAVMDGLGWAKPGPLPPGLLAALADELPVALEDVQAIGAPNGDGRVIVCACPREKLACLGLRTVVVTPAAIPPGIERGAANAASMNLLVGEWEPAPLRLARGVTHRHAAFVCAACLVLVFIGLLRRANHAEEAAVQAARAGDALLASLAADKREESVGAQVRALRQLVEASGRAKPPVDAAMQIEAMLKGWPAGTSAKPLSVMSAGDGVSFGVLVDGDPAPFLKSLVPPAGFVLDEPRINTVGTTTRLALHLRPTGLGIGRSAP